MMPALVESAMQSAEVASYNIKAICWERKRSLFKVNLHGNMVSIGAKCAVAEVVGKKFSGWPATLLKHLVNMHYLWEIGGGILIWDYT